MIGFLMAAMALTALAWAMLWPAMRGGASPHNAAAANRANLGILKEQLQTLDAELAAGSIDASDHRTARIEIERRVLEEAAQASATNGMVAAVAPRAAANAARDNSASRRPTAAFASLCLSIAICAFGLYAVLGNTSGLSSVGMPAAAANRQDDVTPEAMQTMLAEMEKRLDHRPARPDDLQGWTMLARSYAALQMFEQASRAFARASELAPDDAQLIADHADVLAMSRGRQTDGEPARLVEQALRLDPSNLKALALAGSIAFERQDYADAARHWRKARELAPAGSEFAAGLDRSLAEVQSAQFQAPTSDSAAIASTKTASASVARPSAGEISTAHTAEVQVAAGARIAGEVLLSPTLAAKAAPGDTLFVFARAAQGPRMPLAILRMPVGTWPAAFELDDAQAMSPELALSKFEQVIVGARISRSGNAMPQPGDLWGQGTVISSRASGVRVTIDSVQP